MLEQSFVGHQDARFGSRARSVPVALSLALRVGLFSSARASLLSLSAISAEPPESGCCRN
jgi:hypothetical protein